MTREFLENLGLEKEVIDQIMKEHGKAIQSAKPQDYEQIKEENDRLKNTIGELETAAEKYEGYKDQLVEKDSQLKKYKLKNLKYSVAVEAGIPLALADRLSGETEEEIKADAEKLAGFVNQKPTLPLKPTEPQKTDPKEQAYAKVLENLT